MEQVKAELCGSERKYGPSTVQPKVNEPGQRVGINWLELVNVVADDQVQGGIVVLQNAAHAKACERFLVLETRVKVKTKDAENVPVQPKPFVNNHFFGYICVQ